MESTEKYLIDYVGAGSTYFQNSVTLTCAKNIRFYVQQQKRGLVPFDSRVSLH